MELPNKSKAYVATNKLVDYLLSESHAVGKSKARFFRSIGFDESDIALFEQALLKMAQTESVTETIETSFGLKYVLDGKLETPKGVMIHVRTIWIIEKDDDIPRLVTAYPLD